MEQTGEDLAGRGERRGVVESDGGRLAPGVPGEAAEEVVPQGEVGAVVARLGQVGAVVQAVLFRAGQDVVEPADADVDVGVDEVALAAVNRPAARTDSCEKPTRARVSWTAPWATTMSATWLTPLLATLTFCGTWWTPCSRHSHRLVWPRRCAR
ncbi:hypothetical protein SF12_22190 [Streptomyces sp. MBRL 601]|nr:hypothetical protein SF12_22190 [Streptomyces sp. MBRL 601]